MTRALPRPWLTWGLIAANVAVFVALVALGVDAVRPTGGDLFRYGGNLGEHTLGGEPWRLATSMFLHAGLLHLTMNMLALAQAGRQIEILYRPSGMAAIYLVAGLLGALTSAMRGSFVSVGASGAIFGLFGAFAGFLLRHRKKLEPAAAQAATRNIVMLLGINLFISVSVPGIDLGAHLGGLVGGFATGWALEQLPPAWSMLRRAAVIAGLGAVVLVGATYVVPGGKPDVPLAVQEFVEAQARAGKIYNRLVGELRAGTIDLRGFADAVERDVLPVWAAGRQELEQGALDDEYSPLRRRAREREDALRGMVAAGRAGDEDAMAGHIATFVRE